MVNLGVAAFIKFSDFMVIPIIVALVLLASLAYLARTTSRWGGYLLGRPNDAIYVGRRA